MALLDDLQLLANRILEKGDDGQQDRVLYEESKAVLDSMVYTMIDQCVKFKTSNKNSAGTVALEIQEQILRAAENVNQLAVKYKTPTIFPIVTLASVKMRAIQYVVELLEKGNGYQ